MISCIFFKLHWCSHLKWKDGSSHKHFPQQIGMATDLVWSKPPSQNTLILVFIHITQFGAEKSWWVLVDPGFVQENNILYYQLTKFHMQCLYQKQ